MSEQRINQGAFGDEYYERNDALEKRANYLQWRQYALERAIEMQRGVGHTTSEEVLKVADTLMNWLLKP